MKNIMEYRKTSLEFRRLSSNMLNTIADEGNIHLVRLRDYIEKNDIIKEIIASEISTVKNDNQESFIIEHGGWNYVNIPINYSEHIKAIQDYLIEMTKEPMNLREIAKRFICSSHEWDDIVRNYLDKVFKPLVDFITDSLSKEIMLLEVDRPMGNITQNIDKNYGTIYKSIS